MIAAMDEILAIENIAADDYAYDATNQLLGADYADAGRDDESFTYDANGNRTCATAGLSSSDYVTGPRNQLLYDGVHAYSYDGEGNLLARYVDADESGTLNSGDTDITQFTWDHRNRLTEVAHKGAEKGTLLILTV